MQDEEGTAPKPNRRNGYRHVTAEVRWVPIRLIPEGRLDWGLIYPPGGGIEPMAYHGTWDKPSFWTDENQVVDNEVFAFRSATDHWDCCCEPPHWTFTIFDP